ncbi:hypothetical protein CKO31_18200 [Thiohalocapsa halophila]|uniref:HTH cro/C1-type domain-containing protein n=1 Tax=Thiohalocapsa halophila TaxID=69359 RepID=A0ABS1CLR5_9GAMM|nr:helix-turn-helix transcriptional regulator [Thiohalocapsa halophila]MBK1632638.1 hypothetical protein [Thiohalocapsa halophila]
MMSGLNLQRMRLARERTGLTQSQVSKQLKVSASLSGQWERGDKEPGLAKLKELAKLYGVTVSYLLGLDEDRHGASQADGGDRLPASRADVRDAPASGLGLRALAEDADLVAALRIEPTEWAALSSLETQSGLSKLGYVSLLALLRECTIEHRRDLQRLRGRRPRGAGTDEVHEDTAAGDSDV